MAKVWRARGAEESGANELHSVAAARQSADRGKLGPVWQSADHAAAFRDACLSQRACAEQPEQQQWRRRALERWT